MTAALAQSRGAPWAGLIAGTGGWALHQQVLADMLHFNCHLGGAVPGLVGLLLIGVFMIAGGWLSLAARKSAGATALSRFIATLSAMAAAIFLLAVLLQTLATMILPGCGA